MPLKIQKMAFAVLIFSEGFDLNLQGGQIRPPRFFFLPTSLTGRLAKRSLSSSLFFSREPSSLQLLLCDDASRQHHGPRPLHSATNHIFFFAKHSSSRLQVILCCEKHVILFIIPHSLFAPWPFGKYKFQGPLSEASYMRGLFSQNIY